MQSAAAALTEGYPLALLPCHLALHPPPPGYGCTQVAKRELALECNYSYEAAAQGRFRELVAGDPQLAQLFYVPQVGSWGWHDTAAAGQDVQPYNNRGAPSYTLHAMPCVCAPVVCLRATPQVYPELCSRQILTTEWVNGITIDKVGVCTSRQTMHVLLLLVVVCMHAAGKLSTCTCSHCMTVCVLLCAPFPPLFPQVAELSQEVRDHVGTCLLRLTLRELYDWRFMQTDPNWGNFLYDQQSGVLNLIDFGAAKQYPRR